MSIRKDIDDGSYKFPIPINLSRKLKDYLQEEVPTKYLIPEKDMEKIVFKNEITNEYIHIKNLTKKGYLEAHNGDGCYISFMDKKRGTVQKEMIPTLTTKPYIGVVIEPKLIGGVGWRKSNGGTKFYQQDRIYTDDCSSTIVTKNNPYYLDSKLWIRKLTPRECWRLMGIDDKYFEEAKLVNSDTQLYKQAGNGIVVDVFEHLLKGLFE